MTKKSYHVRWLAIVAAIVCLALGGWKLRNHLDQKVVVEIKSFTEGEAVSIAPAPAVFDGAEPTWQAVGESSIKVKKGLYYFKTTVAGNEKKGLISITENGPITLK